MNKNSSSCDGIYNIIIKSGCNHISKTLAYLHMSPAQGIFPDQLKYSIVKPIYKNGDKS
jgi:hypothetical protein